MASVLDIIKHYQKDIEKHSDDDAKVLRCIEKLFQLKVTVQHLQETGVGRTVNALRKEPGEVGQAARALVLKWKTMVAAEESDQEGDHRNDISTQNGHGSGRESDDHLHHSGNSHDRHSSSKSSTPRSNHQEQHREMNGNHSGTKRKYHSSEEEDHDTKKKSRHISSSEDDHKKKVIIKQEKLSESESSDDSGSSDSDSDSYTSESSREVVKVKTEIKQEIKKEKESPERHKSSSHTSKHTHSNHDEGKKESSSSKKHEPSEKDRHSHHKSSKDASRRSSEASKSSSHRNKSSHEKENSSDKRHKSDLSSDEQKESKNKHSPDKHKSGSHKHSSSDRHSSSDTHRSSDRSSEKHSSKENKSSSYTNKAPEKHKSSSEKESKPKSKESSKEKHSSSSKDKSKERSSSSKERSNHSSEKKHSSSESKSHSDKSKHKSDERTSEKKSKEKSSSSSSHKSKSSSSSRSKEDVPKKKVKVNNSEESGEDGIDCGSGASFAEALGMMVSPSKPKKKSFKDVNSPNSSFNNDLSPAALLAPTAKLAPLPQIEISALPEISPNYKPRPPPKALAHFSDEDAISAGISSKNQRTKVYSGNKVIGKITTLYEMCVQVLQEHIDALEYTGGVPYDILKPVIDRATPQQLFTLEHYNPYLMEDTDHLWQKFCEKGFRNKRRQELETWREMYIRCQEEQESKLRSLTANIRLTQEAKKAPIKQTKMAYVDSVVKPPRNIARKQALHGTAFSASASPASRVASLSATPGVLKGGRPPPPAAPVSASSFNKPKKAPLMQKALQFMRGRKR